MSANISDWLLEDIELQALETPDIPITPLATDDSYEAYYFDYNNYTDVYANAIYHDYYDYYDYSVYYDYYNYSVYYDYYDYYNYSNSISVTLNPISQSAKDGETVTFSVRASNTIDRCQWYYATSATSAGIAITGATSPTYSFTALKELDNRYYYCVVTRGGNSATSTRALLTVMSLESLDVCIAQGQEFQVMLINANPPTTTISSITVSDPSVATVTDTGLLTGLSIGKTQCTLVGSNGITTIFNIIVIEDPLVAILMNTAIAIRGYRNINTDLYPNQMANFIRRLDTRKSYDSIESLFTDIADAIREVGGTTESINPVDFYSNIVKLM